MCPWTMSDDTRVLLWHELFCLLAWSCVRLRKHSSRLHLASLSCITTGTVCVLFLKSYSRGRATWIASVSTALCGWDVVLLESVPALPCAAATLRVPPTLCTALFPRAFRPTSARCSLAPWPCSAVEFAWLARPIPSRLLRVARARRRLVTLATVAASLTKCLVVSGHHSTISAFG